MGDCHEGHEDAAYFPYAQPLVVRAALREFWKQAVRWGLWRSMLKAQNVVVSGLIAVERGKYILEFSAGARFRVQRGQGHWAC
jgi:hypothetical protein